MKFRKYWMVLGFGMPTYRHESEQSARTEAERLARIHTGNEFVVLEAVGKVVKSDVAWSEPTDEEDITF